jgi:effector-binding domain-containing protein
MSNVDPAQERRTPMLIKKITDKETESFIFLHGETIASYENIPVAGQKIMDDLNRYIQKHEVAVVGPAVWSYEPVKGKLKLRAGFPVKKGTRGKAPFAAKTEPAWKSVSTEYKGSLEHIIEAWEEFFALVEKTGLGCDGVRREIYRKWVGFDSQDNITELQIRLKKDNFR